MRRLTKLVLLLLLAGGAAGCGNADRADNSHIQTPNDQPIGTPGSLGAAPGQARLVSLESGGRATPRPKTFEVNP